MAPIDPHPAADGAKQMITKRSNGTSTKRGPGRIHAEGVKKTRTPKRTAGDWLGQHTNPIRNAQRANKAQIGARQYRKLAKAVARAAREVA
jgi:hypothetical protein